MAMTKAMTLVKGKKYKRADFGIEFPDVFLGAIDINGERYLFVNIGAKYNNEWDESAYTAIHEPAEASEVVTQDTKPTETLRVFVRDWNNNEEEFTYKGEVDIIKPNTIVIKRNLLVVK